MSSDARPDTTGLREAVEAEHYLYINNRDVGCNCRERMPDPPKGQLRTRADIDAWHAAHVADLLAAHPDPTPEPDCNSCHDGRDLALGWECSGCGRNGDEEAKAPEPEWGPNLLAMTPDERAQWVSENTPEPDAGDVGERQRVTENPQEFLMRTLSKDQWRVVADCLRIEVAEALDAAREQGRAEGEAAGLRAAADEMWRIFLRLPHTPSPLGDYIQRRVIELRARADRDTDGGTS